MDGRRITRRTFIQSTAAATAGAALAAAAAPEQAGAATGHVGQAASDGVRLHWLDGVPATTTGTAWGVPWPRGLTGAHTSFALTTPDGTRVPVQSWPLAYWPDGSLKWSGHAIGQDAGLASTLSLTQGIPAAPASPVTVRRGHGIVLSNGVIDVHLATSGSALITSVTRNGRVTASGGRLVLLLQDRPDEEQAAAQHTSWTGTIEHAEIEQSGPVRAVVKLSGRYTIDTGPEHGSGHRTLLPWTVRVYLGADAESFRLVHSFVWDGDVRRDFIRGLGLEIGVPMTDPAYDRHIRYTGENRGIWGEPVLVLTGLRREAGIAVDQAQFDGTAAPPPSQWTAAVSSGYPALPLWNDFTLTQDCATQFSVWKRTSVTASWLKHAGFGQRSPGFGYAGGVSGGLGFGIRDFWQQYPRALDVRGAAQDTATVTLWSWSPHAAAMDMRPYDSGGHGLDLAYEDNRYGWGIPTGVSRSTDMELWAFAATPSRDRIADLAGALATGPQLVTDPQTYHGAGTFGRWSLPDRSTPGKAAMEDSITSDVAFYAGQAGERQWYGFWDYGDVMHTTRSGIAGVTTSAATPGTTRNSARMRCSGTRSCGPAIRRRSGWRGP
jgi:hypothetical protein